MEVQDRRPISSRITGGDHRRGLLVGHTVGEALEAREKQSRYDVTALRKEVYSRSARASRWPRQTRDHHRGGADAQI